MMSANYPWCLAGAEMVWMVWMQRMLSFRPVRPRDHNEGYYLSPNNSPSYFLLLADIISVSSRHLFKLQNGCRVDFHKPRTWLAGFYNLAGLQPVSPPTHMVQYILQCLSLSTSLFHFLSDLLPHSFSRHIAFDWAMLPFCAYIDLDSPLENGPRPSI